MPKMKTRLIKKTPPADVQFNIIRSEVIKALEPVGEQHVSQRVALVKTWRNKPIWDYKIGVGSKQIRIDIFLTNATQRLRDKKGRFQSGSIADLVKWVFKTGTKAHKIVARRVQSLAFPFMGLDPAFFRSVNHPGTKAKPDIDNINKRLKAFYDKQVRRGYRDGFKRVNKSS